MRWMTLAAVFLIGCAPHVSPESQALRRFCPYPPVRCSPMQLFEDWRCSNLCGSTGEEPLAFCPEFSDAELIGCRTRCARSTGYLTDRDWRDAIGVLVRKYTVVLTDEEMDQEGHVVPGLHWVIATGRGEFDWHNADFLRVPVTRHERELFEGWATRCVMADCGLGCARERWREDKGCTRQELRR